MKEIRAADEQTTSAFMGSKRTQKPTCLLAEPLVSDRVAILHKNVLRTSGRGCDEQSSRSSARKPRRLGSAGRTRQRISTPAGPPSERILPGTRFPSSRRNSAKLPDRRARFAFQKQGREPLGKFGAGSGALPSSSNLRLHLHLRQRLMHEVNRDRSFADSRRHALHIAGPDIPHRKHPR
jgi:hypothetical protein